MNLPYSLQNELGKVADSAPPPVHLWHPERVYPIDMLINDRGDWIYEGSQITRARLIRLFARVLRRTNDEYYLVTPVEACRIVVEDVPFVGVALVQEGQGAGQKLTITTNVGDQVTIGASNPLRFEVKEEVPLPYVLIRDGLWAKLNRNTYYQLMNLLIKDVDSAQWLIWSAGKAFTVPV